jgi:hypothetical protein
MSIKLLWTGLTLVLAFSALGFEKPWVIAGAIILVVGCVLLWLDK